jgi:hypothetical protein
MQVTTSHLHTEKNTPIVEANSWLLFGVLVALYALLTWIQSKFLVTDQMYFQELSEQLAYERIEKMLETKDRYAWISYVFLPIFLLLRIFYTTLCVYAGVYFQDWKLSFRKVWRVVLFADMVWLLPALIKVVYFSLQTDYTLTEMQNFYPYSLLALFDVKSLDKWLVYPIYIVNFLELSYMMVLAYGLKYYFQKSYQQILLLVVSSYGVGVLLWVTLISFLTKSICDTATYHKKSLTRVVTGKANLTSGCLFCNK